MPTIGASLKQSYRGAWSSATTYALNDVVNYNSAAYVATAPSTNQTPNSPSSYWGVLSATTTPFPYQPWTSGGTFSAPVTGAGITGPQTNDFRLFPIKVPNPCTISGLGINVVTALAAASEDFWLYNDTGANKPGTRLGTVNISMTATGYATTAFASPVVISTAQQIWVAYRLSAASGASVTAVQAVMNFLNPLAATSSLNVRTITTYSGTATVPADLSAATLQTAVGYYQPYLGFTIA